MAQIDRRNTVEHLHVGGSDVGLEVFLTETQAQQFYGGSAVAGCYIIGTLDGGTIANEVQAEEDRDEAGQLTGKTIVETDDFVLTNAFKESDDATLDLIDELLTKGFFKYRYALPAGTGVVEEGPPEVTGPVHQVYGIENGKIERGWEQPTQAGEKRLRNFTLRGSKQGSTPPYVRATVSLAHEEDWPAKLDPFKTPAA